MIKKLDLATLKADLSSVEQMLAARTEENDPIGFYQLSNRKSELISEIEKLNATSEMSASVALFFGGAPVLGSKGIDADFAGKAIEAFQNIITKRFATVESGALGQRGPIPLRTNAGLMLTDVARGSFGLILEEINSNGSLTETALCNVVDEVTQTIVNFASVDNDTYETALATVDSRYLISLRDFFRLLDDKNATVRLVEGGRDAELDSKAIQLARQRTDFTSIEDKTTDEVVGDLFILPAHRRFELKVNSSETLYGSISSEFPKEDFERLQQDNMLGKSWRVRLRIRETLRLNQQSTLSYTLIGLIEKQNDQRLFQDSLIPTH